MYAWRQPFTQSHAYGWKDASAVSNTTDESRSKSRVLRLWNVSKVRQAIHHVSIGADQLTFEKVRDCSPVDFILVHNVCCAFRSTQYKKHTRYFVTIPEESLRERLTRWLQQTALYIGDLRSRLAVLIGGSWSALWSCANRSRHESASRSALPSHCQRIGIRLWA